MKIVWLWYAENATDAERLVWQKWTNSDAMLDAVSLEAENKEEFEKTHERLIEEGWIFNNIGSGPLMRLSGYTKSNT